MNPEQFISDRARSVDASGIRRMFDLGATLNDPINFSIGQPDYDVPESIQLAAIQAIRARKNGYTPTQGIEPLIQKITLQLQDEFDDYQPGVFVTSGLSGGLTLALLACMNPGDHAILPDPYFVAYKHLVRLAGGVPAFLDTYPDFRIAADRLDHAVTPKTRILLINSPGNPTGVSCSAEELADVAQVARKHNLLIIADEIYRDLSYDGPCPSMVSHAPERTLLLRGFGKTYGMTGWRLGYAAGPAPIIAQLSKLQQYTFVMAPSIAQYAGLAALDLSMTGQLQDYRHKRDLVVQLLGSSFEFARPTGGFYVFPKAPAHFADATEFINEAINRNLLAIPGNIFSERDTHFRVSYAVSDDKLRQGCEILCRMAAG